jgi:hypothetical protein
MLVVAMSFLAPLAQGQVAPTTASTVNSGSFEAPVAQGQFTPLQSNSTCNAPVPPQVTTVKNVLLGLFVGIQAIIWVVIGLAWITGNMMWAAPTKSMIIKKGGQQQMEIAGISLFLTLMGPGIFALITFLAAQFGAAVWGFC